MEKRPSLKDIAKKVGVSTALVSFVLNGQAKEKRVGAEMAKKILATAKELNYKPNQIARSLRKGSTMTIGLIVADISNPFFGYLARYIEDEANKFGYTVIFGSSDESKTKTAALIDVFTNRQVDGFIIVPTEGSEDQVKGLIQKKVPVVLVDRYFPQVTSNVVVLNNYEASADAVTQLIRSGRKKIGIIAYKSSLIHMHDRIAGYVDTMKSQNLEFIIKEIRMEEAAHDIEKAIHELAVEEKKVDALYFVTNSLSIAGLYCIQQMNISIPKDLAIMCFDESPAFDFFQPPISYVKQPIDELGKESVKLLVDLINGSTKTTNITLKHTLVNRKSS